MIKNYFKYFLLLITAATVSLLSCSKDDDSDGSIEDELNKYWVLKSNDFYVQFPRDSFESFLGDTVDAGEYSYLSLATRYHADYTDGILFQKSIEDLDDIHMSLKDVVDYEKSIFDLPEPSGYDSDGLLADDKINGMDCQSITYVFRNSHNGRLARVVYYYLVNPKDNHIYRIATQGNAGDESFWNLSDKALSTFRWK